MMRFAPESCRYPVTLHRCGGRLLAVACLWWLLTGAITSWAAERRAGMPIEVGDRPVLGVATAALLVVEISNFKCSQCRSFHEKVFPTLRKDYIDTGKIQWVVVNASDDESEQYGKIFALARCAHRQGKYWDLLDGLFSVAHRAPSVLEELVAKSPLIDRAALEICLRDRSVRSAVTNDFADAARLKIRGTPTFVVSKAGADGQRTEVTIAGAQSLDYFRRAFDALLSKP
jgi:protein-disulfide isomerase